MSNQDEDIVILEPEGLYADTTVEDAILATSLSQKPFKVYQASLSEADPYSDLSKDLRESVHGLFVYRHWFNASDIPLFPRLQVVVRMGVGYDRLDREALDKARVLVCNCPDYGTTEVANHAIALALTLRRGILLHHDSQRTLVYPSPNSISPPKPAEWTHIVSPLIQRSSANKTFGVLGLGRIGTATALYAKALSWSNVLFFDPNIRSGVDRALGITRVRTIEELFKRSDTLSVHVPLTKQTRGLVGERLIGMMKKDGVLVNTSRGKVVDLDAVESALKNGRLGAAALDVLPDEPIPDPPHPLIKAYREGEEWLRGRLVITPHVGFYSLESWDDIRTLSSETMRDVLIDGLKTNVINVEDE